MKIALAAKRNDLGLAHFGTAEYFSIYDFSQGQASFLEERRVIPFCGGSRADDAPIEEVVSALGDCSLVCTAQAGPCALKVLNQRKIHVLQGLPTVALAWESIAKIETGEQR
jgi:predicted Fe-Mo cluster-binding NifX family protein